MAIAPDIHRPILNPGFAFKLPPIDCAAMTASDVPGIDLQRPVAFTLDPDISYGPIARPAEDSLWGHKYILIQGKDGIDIRFSPKTYPLFDAILYKECGPAHPAFNETDRRYRFYAPLRRNLAILRNYLMGRHSPQGENAEFNKVLLTLMATKLGGALRGEAKPGWIAWLWLCVRQIMAGKQPHARGYNLFLELANTPDRGIAFMHDYLGALQETDDFMMGLPTSKWPQGWRVPPLNETPFSGHNMLKHSDFAQMEQIATALDTVTKNLRNVDDMQETDKKISVEHARDILKNMRIIASGIREEKTYDTIDARVADAHDMLQIGKCFKGELAELAKSNQTILNEPAILQAADSLSKASSRIRADTKAVIKEARRTDEKKPEEKRPENQQQQSAPSRSRANTQSKQKTKVSFVQMVQRIEVGLHRVDEVRRNQLIAMSKKKEKSFIKAPSMASLKGQVHQAVHDGQSMMSNPKIHQVSLSDNDFINTVKHVNELDAKREQQKAPVIGKPTQGRTT